MSERLSVDTESECDDIGGDWDDEFGVCYEHMGEDGGRLARIDGADVMYGVHSYEADGETYYVPSVTATTPDGAILHQGEHMDKKNFDAALREAKRGAANLGQDIQRSGVGSSVRSGMEKYRVGGDEVVAGSERGAREAIEWVEERNRGRSQSSFSNFATARR